MEGTSLVADRGEGCAVWEVAEVGEVWEGEGLEGEREGEGGEEEAEGTEVTGRRGEGWRRAGTCGLWGAGYW